MNIAQSRPDARADIDWGAATAAGLAAGAAYAMVQEVDLQLTDNRVDDLLILGRPFSKDPRKARLFGLVFHAANSVALAVVYAALERRLSGPPWLRGVVFANLENVLLYPITRFEHVHPAVRDGQVDSYRTWPSFWQSVPRHVAYGFVLGVGYARFREWLEDE